jgi:riboflavin kinase / FMN adenylyltransferase
MEILRDNFKSQVKNPTFIVLGSFDGIHQGHKALIENAIHKAKEYNKIVKNENLRAKVMVCTFKNHPLAIINKDLAPKLIMDNEQKIQVLKKLGVDIVNLMDFNKEFMKITPEDFILNLKKCYNAEGIIVGFNYRFGYKNLGDTELLKEFSNTLDFKLTVVEPIIVDEEVVSSSAIRHHIQEGNIQRANKFLTRPLMLTGKVIKGRQLGRTIGFPTINLNYNKKFIIPQGGVYFTCVIYKDQIYKGITNVGYNPTVEGKKLSIETHVLNFNEYIYNEEVKICFMAKIRDEKKFQRLDDLKRQLDKDKNFASSQEKCSI